MHDGFVHAGQVFERFHDVPVLPPQLFLIPQILPAAAPAESKMRAKRCHIVRRLRKVLNDVPFGKLSLFPGDPNPYPLSWKGMIHKDDQAVQVCQGLSPERELFNKQLNFRAFANITHLNVTALMRKSQLVSFFNAGGMVIQIRNNG
jgi:hypothetical protein